VTDRHRRVLLVRFDFPSTPPPHGLWACPGGGLDPGETAERGVRRELREECGLGVDDVGTPVWRKEHLFAFQDWDGQHDTFFWVEVDAFEPCPAFTEEELRAENLVGMRWWTPEEVAAGQRAYDAGDVRDPCYTVFSPRRFGHHFRDLLERGRPAEPIQVDAP
jgi:8-oxo-dGTP pyrophosphatase MutT (NUDIX family)